MSLTKVTSNVIASGVIPAEYDDANVRSDILKLALSQAVDGNRVAYNLENSFIDGFEDDTGITTETTVDRDTTGEYVSSATSSDTVTTPASASDWTGDTGSYTLTSGGADSTSGDDSIKSNWTSGTGDFTIQLTVTAYSNQTFGIYPVSEDGSFASNDSGGMSGMTNSWWWQGNSAGEAAKARYTGSSYTFSDSDLIEDGSVVQIKRVSGTISILIDGATRHTYSQTSTANLRFAIAHHGTTNGNIQSMTFTAPSTTTNATGTLISDSQTASSSRTSCSGVIVYEDSDGTATLGSDLKIYFTCNNGTNWTEASSYGTATTYSGSKKLVKLGATTVSAGSAIAMKSVWANQVQGVDAVSVWQTGNRSIGVTGSPSVSSGNYLNWVDGDTTASASKAWYWDDNGTVDSNRWIKLDFNAVDGGSGATRIITEFRYHSNGYDNSSNPDSGTFKWQGSNDDTNWTDIGSNWAMATNLGWNTFSTTINNNTTAYRYYKIVGVSGTSHNPWMTEIEFKVQTQAAVAGKQTLLHGWAVNY